MYCNIHTIISYPVVSSRCTEMVTAIKGFTIHRSCNVLTLSLKRFSVFSGDKILKVPLTCPHYDTGTKINGIGLDYEVNLCVFGPQDVIYPEYLNLRPFMSQSQGEPQVYTLYAVLVHSGFSCHAGHYFCYIKVWSRLQTALTVKQNNT